MGFRIHRHTRQPARSGSVKAVDGMYRPGAAVTAGLWLALLPVSLVSPQAASAQVAPPPVDASRPRSGEGARAAPQAKASPRREAHEANFQGETASPEARHVADWVAGSGDNKSLPFMIVDKRNAKVFMFDGRGQILGAAPALLGLGRGDDTVAGIGQRRLATMRPEERTTPAGRFEAALGHDLEQDVLWIDYDAALSLHRVIVGNPSERRFQRLASASPLDNGISYGCINVPVQFYEKVVMPAFRGTVGIVYILPETKPVRAVFAIPDPMLVREVESVADRYLHLEDSRAGVPR